MPLSAGIRIDYDPWIRFVQVKETEVKAGQKVIISTEFGDDTGVVTVVTDKELPQNRRQPDYKLLRAASAEDIERIKKNQADTAETLAAAREKVLQYNLPMNLVHSHYLFDRSKLLFFFTAENRVDFRELVKDLATVFRTRIELRQISSREATRITGGLGVCGLEVCCHKFRIKFDSITLKCARHQNLTPNIAKLSGLCNKPYCCLLYENQMYIQLQKRFPRVNAMVMVTVAALPEDTRPDTDKKELKAIIRDINVIKGTLFVRLETEAMMEIPVEAVRGELKGE